MSLNGFLEWQAKELGSDKRSICSKLRAFGYGPCLHLHDSFDSRGDSMDVQTQWTHKMDDQLIQYVNQIWETSGVDSLNLTATCLCIPKHSAQQWQLISDVTLRNLRQRFCLLSLFNQTLTECVSVIDLTNQDKGTLANRIFSLRHLIFYDVKIGILHQVLKRSIVESESVTIYLSRLSTRTNSDNSAKSDSSNTTASNENSLFMQAMSQLDNLDPQILRQRDRSFKVILKGEHAEGEVGPYREGISKITSHHVFVTGKKLSVKNARNHGNL